jgi:nicotinate phosphoribosyltransferase
VLAGQRYGLPVLGTHAHSWVMSFDDESEAFERYAEAMPDNSTLLVDTYDTLGGVNHAIATARTLRKRGHELTGIRLDSGDLAWLSQQARVMLDAAGFPEVKIVASNDLDEHIIESLRHQGAKIDTWGVGTNLVTAADQPALGGVYKLAALRREDGTWQPRIKLSEQTAKSSIPGRLQVRRFEQEGMLLADAIYDVDRGIPDDEVEIVDPGDPIRRKSIPKGTLFREVLQPVMKEGKRVAGPESLDTIRARCKETIAKMHPGTKRLVNPHTYPAGLEQGLHEERERMLTEYSKKRRKSVP